MTSGFSKSGRLRPRIYDFVCQREERAGLLAWRKELLEGVIGPVLEIGAGTGLNFRHYPTGTAIFALEPDPFMLERAIPRVERSPGVVSLVTGSGEALPFPDGSFRTVVISLSLCSVPSQDRVLAEVARVLEPGGTFRFLEHIRDPKGGVRARFQDRFNPIWQRVSGGCNCNRRTVQAVLASGFKLDQLKGFKIGPPHVAPHVYGEATLLEGSGSSADEGSVE